MSELAATPAVLGLEMTDHWPNQQRLWNLYSGVPDKFYRYIDSQAAAYDLDHGGATKAIMNCQKALQI